MYDDKSLVVNPNIFDGKSEEEIIEICKKYLGECDVEHRFFPNALSHGSAIFNYGDRLWSISHGIGQNHTPLDAEERRDLGVTGSPGFETGILAARALNEEALEIANTGIRGKNRSDNISKEEVERRTGLISTFASKEAIEKFADNSLYRWYYIQPLEEIESSFKESGSSIVNSLKKDLPQFFQMVESLLANNIEIDQIEMAPGYTVLDVYNIIKNKFSKYISNGKIIDPKKDKKVEEEKTIEQEKKSSNQEIDNMVEKSDNNLSIEEIQKRIEENNRKITELMNQNNELLQELSTKMNKSTTQTR